MNSTLPEARTHGRKHLHGSLSMHGNGKDVAASEHQGCTDVVHTTAARTCTRVKRSAIKYPSIAKATDCTRRWGIMLPAASTAQYGVWGTRWAFTGRTHTKKRGPWAQECKDTWNKGEVHRTRVSRWTFCASSSPTNKYGFCSSRGLNTHASTSSKPSRMVFHITSIINAVLVSFPVESYTGMKKAATNANMYTVTAILNLRMRSALLMRSTSSATVVTSGATTWKPSWSSSSGDSWNGFTGTDAARANSFLLSAHDCTCHFDSWTLSR